MWALAEHVRRMTIRERIRIGESDCDPDHPALDPKAEFVWGRRYVGHICRGEPWGDHSECIMMTAPAWVWRRRRERK